MAESVVSDGDDDDMDDDDDMVNETPDYSAAVEGLQQLEPPNSLISSVYQICSTDTSVLRPSPEKDCRSYQKTISVEGGTHVQPEVLLNEVSIESSRQAQQTIPITRFDTDSLHQKLTTPHGSGEGNVTAMMRATVTDTVASSDRDTVQSSGSLGIAQGPSTSGGSGSFAPPTPCVNAVPHPKVKSSEVPVPSQGLDSQSTCSSSKRDLHEGSESCAKKRKASRDPALASVFRSTSLEKQTINLNASTVAQGEKRKAQLSLEELPCLVDLSSQEVKGEKLFRGMRKYMKKKEERQYSYAALPDCNTQSVPLGYKSRTNDRGRILNTASQDSTSLHSGSCFRGIHDQCITPSQTLWIQDHWASPSFQNGISHNDKNIHEIGTMNRNTVRNKVDNIQKGRSSRRKDNHVRHFPTISKVDGSQLAPTGNLYNSRADLDTMVPSLCHLHWRNGAFQVLPVYNIGVGSEHGLGMNGCEIQLPNRDNSFQVSEFPGAVMTTLPCGPDGKQPQIMFNREMQHNLCFQYGSELANPGPCLEQTHPPPYSAHPSHGGSCQFSQVQTVQASQRSDTLGPRCLEGDPYDSVSKSIDIQNKVGQVNLKQAQRILGFIRELAQEESMN